MSIISSFKSLGITTFGVAKELVLSTSTVTETVALGTAVAMSYSRNKIVVGKEYVAVSVNPKLETVVSISDLEYAEYQALKAQAKAAATAAP